MEQAEKLPERKRNRLQNYDYSAPGAYFITICTKDRKKMFWAKEPTNLVGEDIILPQETPELSDHGKIVDQCIRDIPLHYPNVQLREYVIMPNHVHLILFIPYLQGGRMISSPTENSLKSSENATIHIRDKEKFPPSILYVIGQMKRFVSKKIGVPIWQRSFHDHVIRDREDYEMIATYIRENPIKWQYDCLYI